MGIHTFCVIIPVAGRGNISLLHFAGLASQFILFICT